MLAFTPESTINHENKQKFAALDKEDIFVDRQNRLVSPFVNSVLNGCADIYQDHR